MGIKLSTSDLNARFKTKLAESSLTLADAKKLGFQLMTGEEAASTLKLSPFAGFKIPYFDERGKPTKFWRFRFLEDTRTGVAALTDAKPIKYMQPPHTTNEVYMPPFIDWNSLFADPTKEIVITEGELKAACACKLGIPTVALGGVWTFMSKKSKLWMLPFFTKDTKRWNDRSVLICFDSDAATNPNVLAAEIHLAKQLTKLGAPLSIMRLPNIEGREKTGLDDFLTILSPAEFLELRTEVESYEESRALHELNSEVVYVRDPGLIMKLENLQRMSPQSFTAHAYSTRIHRIISYDKDGREKFAEKSAAIEWLKWPNRFEAERAVYLPERPIMVDDQINVWPGYGTDGTLEPLKGDIGPWNEYLDWIFPEKEDASDKAWFEQWCACPIQRPGIKMRNAVLFWSGMEGSGKSMIGENLLPIVYGRNATMISESDLIARHNEWAENVQFVLGDEIGGQSDNKRQIAEIVKTTVTRPKIRVNPKFIPAYEMVDCINYIFTSNKPDAFVLSANDRRYFVHRAPEIPMPLDLRDRLITWCATRAAAEALYYHLKTIHLNGFDPFAPPPITNAKREMIDAAQSDLTIWINQLKSDPDSILKIGNAPLKYSLYTSEQVLDIFIKNKQDGMRGRYSVALMGRELASVGLRRAAKGFGCPTKDGQLKLWSLRNAGAYEKLGKTEIGRIYDDERTASGPLKKTLKFARKAI